MKTLLIFLVLALAMAARANENKTYLQFQAEVAGMEISSLNVISFNDLVQKKKHPVRKSFQIAVGTTLGAFILMDLADRYKPELYKPAKYLLIATFTVNSVNMYCKAKKYKVW